MEPLVKVMGLKKHFPIKTGLFQRPAGWIRAVDGIDLEISRDQIFGLVGESGSGKTTVGRAILRLYQPTAGKIIFKGQDILNFSPAEMIKLRARIQIIYQDPHASLNPRMRIGTIIKRALDIHTRKTQKEKQQRTLELMRLMGLLPEHYNRFPHELSGGQQQRVGIARALANDPEFVVMDEPTSSLDVSVQAQILNLLKKLQQNFHLGCLFISHDMRVINHICNRIAVMYAGKIVEVADRDTLFRSPKHPYTQVLIASIPDIDRETKRNRIHLHGDFPSSAAPSSGCRFHPRCPQRMADCHRIEPKLTAMADAHACACWLQTESHAAQSPTDLPQEVA